MVRLRPSLRFISVALISLVLVVCTSRSLQAAETIFLDYGPLSRSIPVSSLVAFAEDGVVDDNLAFFINLLDPEQQENLRTGLTASRQADVVRVSQWFNTPMGERVLLFAGKLIETGARQNGQIALRSALVAAAAEDGGISVLDVARHFPTENLRLDLDEAVLKARQVIDEAEATLALVEAVKQQSTAEAAEPPPFNLAALPDLTQPGPYPVRQINLILEDPSRTGQALTLDSPRTFPATLFLPQDLTAVSGSIPVVIISHGLGDTRTNFYDIAAQIASYGFAVAVPEHIGSNTTQKEAMFSGFSQETFRAQEFLDRPLDISFLLDELERTNADSYGGRLDLSRVAIAGHSFGGYTAFALAGATIDFDRLAQRCDLKSNILLDAATVLECRALELLTDPAAVQSLGVQGTRDQRVKLIMAFAPVSNLFGPQGIRRVDIPVMVFGGAFDIVAPVVPQQVAAFSWLTTPERYLYLGENTSHGADITRLTSRLFHIDRDFDQGVDEGLAITRRVNTSLMLAFSEVYLLGQSEFEPFLRSAFVEAVSVEPFRLHLVRELPPGVERVLGEYQYD